MEKNSSQRLKIECRRAEIAKLYRQGIHSQSELAKRLEVNRSTISRDLAAIQKRWQEEYIQDINAVKAESLAKVDAIEKEYWQGWERSREEFRARAIKAKGIKTDNRVQTKPEQAEQTIRTENRSGDPRFLDGVLRCIERRCRLLGLDAPTKNEHIGKDGRPVVIDRRKAVRQHLKSNPELVMRLKNALRD